MFKHFPKSHLHTRNVDRSNMAVVHLLLLAVALALPQTNGIWIPRPPPFGPRYFVPPTVLDVPPEEDCHVWINLNPPFDKYGTFVNPCKSRERQDFKTYQRQY